MALFNTTNIYLNINIYLFNREEALLLENLVSMKCILNMIKYS